MSAKFPLLTLWALIAVMGAGYGQTTPSFLENVLAGRAPAVPDEGVPFYVEPGKTTAPQLERHNPAFKRVRSTATAEVDGARSSIRLSETKPLFLVKLAVPPRRDLDVILRFDSTTGKRSIFFTIAAGMANVLPSNQFEFQSKSVGSNLYLIRPESHLPPGEYLILFGKISPAFSFGIDPGAVDTPDPLAASTQTTSAENPNSERLKKLDALLEKSLITKADYDARKEEILHPQPVKPPTMEDRLRKLDDLLKKGLIGRPEYDKKRAELLSEI